MGTQRVRRLTGAAKWFRLRRLTVKAGLFALPARFTAFLIQMLCHEKLTVVDGRTYINAHYPALESPAMRTVFRSLRRVAAGEHRMLALCISPTWRCPMKCFYCSTSSFARDGELGTARLIELVREAQDLGVFAVHVSGGEPLLRDDLPEIVAAVDDRSVTILYTSGLNFPPMSRQLRRAGLDHVVVSLDSFDETVNHERRGSKDAHRVALEAAQAAVNEGFYTVMDVVMGESMLDRAAFEDYVETAGRLGVHEVRLTSPRLCVALGGNKFDGFTDAQKDQLRRFQFRTNRCAHLPTVTSLDYIESAAGQGCFGGSALCHITPSGEVTPCEMYPVSFGNIASRPLAEVYENMRQHIPYPPARCPTREVFRLLGDTPTEDLPVRDPEKVDWLFRHLAGRGSPLPAFWQKLGVCKAD